MSLPDSLTPDEIEFLEVAAIAFGSTPEKVLENMKKQRCFCLWEEYQEEQTYENCCHWLKHRAYCGVKNAR